MFPVRDAAFDNDVAGFRRPIYSWNDEGESEVEDDETDGNESEEDELESDNGDEMVPVFDPINIIRSSDEEEESEVEYDGTDGNESGGEELEGSNDDQHETDKRIPRSLYHDVSDIKPWGKPRTEDHIVIENIRAIAIKHWREIAIQDTKSRNRDEVSRPITIIFWLQIVTLLQRIKPNGKVPCLVLGCAHKSSNNAVLGKHLSTHFPPSTFCPVCLRTLTRGSSLPRHADRQGSGSCKRILEERFMLRGRGKRKLYQWFNLYFLGLRDDVEMTDETFLRLAKRKRNDPLYT